MKQSITTMVGIFMQTVFLLCSALDIAVKPTGVDAAARELQFTQDEMTAVDFLRRYGYLPSTRRVRIPLTRATFTNALNNYQVMADLPIDEHLDSTALSSMQELRCGNPDVERSERTGIARYEILAPRWRKGNLTYRVSLYPSGNARLSKSVVDASLKKAMKMWSDVSRIDFIQIDQSTRRPADIDIRFERSGYDAACQMYFQMGELAHATMMRPSKVHFNGRISWRIGLSRDASGVDLILVAAHEIGHVLGLDHSPDRRALMFASYRRENTGLGRDDVLAIQALYGARKPGEHRPEPDGSPETDPDPVGCPRKVTSRMPDGKRTLCAAVYTGSSCGGKRLPIEEGNKTRQLSNEWDNEIASAEVNPSCTLKVCHRRSFTGGCIDLQGEKEGHNFNRMPLGYNGMITSLACTCDEQNDDDHTPTTTDPEPDPEEPSEHRETVQKGKEPPAYIPNGNGAKTCAVLVQNWKKGATKAWVEEETAIRMPASLVGVNYEYMATRRGCSLYVCTRPAFAGICETLGPSRHATSNDGFEVSSLSCECE